MPLSLIEPWVLGIKVVKERNAPGMRAWEMVFATADWLSERIGRTRVGRALARLDVAYEARSSEIRERRGSHEPLSMDWLTGFPLCSPEFPNVVPQFSVPDDSDLEADHCLRGKRPKIHLLPASKE